MVVPVLGRHQDRYEETGESRSGGRPQPGLIPGLIRDPCIQGSHGEADPDREHIEGTRVRVIPLADLIGRLVQVEDDRDAGHEEHQEDNPAAALVPVELEQQTEKPQQQGQEEIVVLALIVLQAVRSIGLIAETQLVERRDATLPVPVENIAGDRTVDVVLTADKIPHEIPPVHPIQLIIKEISQISAHRRLPVLGPLDAGLLPLCIGFVEIDIPVVLAGPHPREKHLPLPGISRFGRGVGMDIFSVERSPVLAQFQVIRGIVILTIDKRRAAVLLPAEIPDKGIGVIGLVLIGRSLDGRADDHDAEQGEPDYQRCDTKKDRIGEDFLFLESPEKSPETSGDEGDHEEGGSAVVRQAESVHEYPVEEGRQLRKVRDKEEHQKRLDNDTDHENAQQLLERQLFILILPVIVHEDESREGQEVQQMDPDRKAHQQGDQDDPTVGMGFVRLLVPLAHRPEDDRREQGRHRIDLAFDGREPERIRETVSQGTDGSTAEDDDR